MLKLLFRWPGARPPVSSIDDNFAINGQADQSLLRHVSCGRRPTVSGVGQISANLLKDEECSI